MLLINLAINLFSVLKVNTIECLSVINRKCMPRPKILEVNERIGEALFYLYNVLVNKCSRSCNNLDNPMSKICIPKVIKNVNIKVYNFLMRLNETRNGTKVVNACVDKIHQYVIVNKFGIVIVADAIVMKILLV